MKQKTAEVYNYVTAVHLSDANNPVSQAHALFLFVFSVLTIMTCCFSTTICVQAARDSNIALNVAKMHRKYQRNMQLYMMIKEKQAWDRRAAKGDLPSSNSESQYSSSQTDSSFATSQGDESSYEGTMPG